jgi:hypothetical protein
MLGSCTYAILFPCHIHFEQSEARTVTVVGSAVVEEVRGSFDAVETDHMPPQDLEMDHIGV